LIENDRYMYTCIHRVPQKKLIHQADIDNFVSSQLFSIFFHWHTL